MRAPGRNQVTYQTITLTAAAAETPPPGGGTETPPPGGGVGTTTPPPPPLAGGGGGDAQVSPGGSSANEYEATGPDGTFGLTWQPAGTSMQVSLKARAMGVNPPGFVAFAFTDNGKMVGSSGATLALVGERPTGMAPPVGRRLQNGLPPPTGGLHVEVYLIRSGGAVELVQSTNPALASCGINLQQSNVEASGTELTLSFPVSVKQSGETTCNINGAEVAGFYSKSGNFARVLMAMGSETTFGQQDEASWLASSRDVLCDQPDGSCRGGSNMNLILAGVVGIGVLCIGLKVLKDKRDGNKPPPPPSTGGEMATVVPPGGGYPAVPQPNPQQYGGYPPQGGGGWMAQMDPASGQTYYVNPSNGQTSWERPAGFV